MHPPPPHSRARLIAVSLTLALLVSLSFFLYWTVTVVTPVVAVELSYQSKRALTNLFGTADLRQLIIPHFSFGIAETSRHPDGSVVIPSLFLDEPIIYNVDPNNESAYLDALKHGIAQASSTRLPGYGGLGYYFAHSSSPALARQFNAVFYLLGKLKGGEKISLWHLGKEYSYVVRRTKITSPDDVSFLHDSYATETIVLQTCWPPGTTNRRLLVFAERTEEE